MRNGMNLNEMFQFTKPLHKRTLPSTYTDAGKLATKVIKALGRVPDDDFLRSARQFLTAVIIHVHHAEEDKTLRGVRDFIFDYGSYGYKK